MKSIFQDYTMLKMNEEVSQMITNDKVNNLKLFVASDEAKLSVTLKSEDNCNQQYHGLHPKFDDKALLNLLSSNDVNNSESFWNVIKRVQEANQYMNLILNNMNRDIKIGDVPFTEKLKKEVEETLFGRAILQMASHFGFRFKAEYAVLEKLQDYLINIWGKYPDGFTKAEVKQENDGLVKTLYWQINLKELYVDFLGIWPSEIIENIGKHYQIYLDDSQSPIIVNNNVADNIQFSELLSFSPEYLRYFRLRTSTVYYSGVMPRVMEIEYVDNPTSSNNIKYLIFHVVRTTYATVDFMDNPSIIKHPFFLNEKMDCSRYNQMIKFDMHEDNMQEKFLYSFLNCNGDDYTQREYEISEISKINNYLKHSFNTHTIAVSANIVTKDKYLLLGKRGNISIDSGEYYCSANGQSEFRDEDVSFYHTSVFEDLPSMDYNSKYRIDLNNEIQRESIAELGVSVYDNDWKYYGVSYLSIHNNKDMEISEVSTSNIKSRRMHFNVLTSNSTPLCFEDVIKSYEYATEKFENSMIKGLKTNIFKNKSDRRKKRLLSLYDWCYENKSRIFLIIFFVSYIFNKDNNLKVDISNIVDMILLIASVVAISSKWLRSKDVREKKIKISLLVTKYLGKDRIINMNTIIEALSSKMKKGKEKENLHAIFKVMYILYFLDNK